MSFGMVNAALNIGLPAVDAYGKIKEGEGVVSSVAKAGFSAVAGEVVFGVLGAPAAFGLMAATMAKTGIEMATQHGQRNAQNFRPKTSGMGKIGAGDTRDSRHGQTMRQRQLEQMGGHQGAVQSSLGSEARRRSLAVSY